MSEQNKALARRGIDEIFNQGKLEVIYELVAGSATFHDASVPGGKYDGTEGLKQFATIYRTAFPDLRVTVNDQIAEGDKLVTRWTATGTHKGELMGIAPTGKHVTVTGMNFERYQNGKLAESWSSSDTLGMFQQLGVIPSMSPAATKV